jgi:hypothetical protein
MVSSFIDDFLLPLLPAGTIVLLYHSESVFVGQCGFVEPAELGEDVRIALDSL